MSDVTFQCECGCITGSIEGASGKTGNHAECFCASCRAGEIYAGSSDPAPGPVGIFQTAPHRIKLHQGQDRLAIFSFGPKNLLRWHATCCGSALFNTPRNPGLSFVGVRTSCMPDVSAIGPVVGQGFIPAENGKTRHNGLAKLMFSSILRIMGKRLSGRWKDTPFFDVSTRTPIAPVTVLSKEERRALLT